MCFDLEAEERLTASAAEKASITSSLIRNTHTAPYRSTGARSLLSEGWLLGNRKHMVLPLFKIGKILEVGRLEIFIPYLPQC